PYTLQDMANDTVGLMDALSIKKAHVVGASMGGMIAQLVAASNPGRVLSMVSFMSTSGSRRVPLGKMKCILRLGHSAKSEAREDVLQHMVDGWKLYASPSFPREPGDLMDWAGKIYDRSYYPEGSTRQFRAVLNDGSRVLRLRKINVPTLAMHGSADPLVHPAGSKDVARQVPGAKLVLIDGLGHELPPKALPVIAAHVLEHVASAEGQEPLAK
ncbi:MAG: alpha/beta hydrolase, partial [Gammaproteobacteria bacterium]|nr:alpha/beta hydrolase [Gammaproteobacteria bacterium]